MANKHEHAKLSVCALGTAIGLIWGLGILLLAYISIWFDIATPIVDLLSSGYLGYQATYFGGLIGLIWGIVDGFIFGALIAWVYNYCAKNCWCCCKK